jgi:tetrapyrrole methylase family protein / MazG family protein
VQIDQPGLTIVGLGPGTWDDLTVQAARTLESASEVYVRTSVHPSLDPIRAHVPDLVIHSFDSLYEELPTFSAVYDRIADTLVDLVQRSPGLVYAVPGSPFVGETSVRLLLERLRAVSIPVKIVQGLSMIEPILSAAGVTDASWLEVLDAVEIGLLSNENAVGEVPGEDTRLPWRSPVPTAPALVAGLYDRRAASGVKLWLGKYYPDQHPVQLVRLSGSGEITTRDLPLYQIDRDSGIDASTGLFVPPLSETDNVRTFAGLMQLTRTLRAPGGCPWDREQSHASLKPHLLEEAYEVLDALDSNDPALIAEELGDLLFQVTIHSQIAAEAGTFTIEDVIEGIMRKLIGRHPHVFGDLELSSAQDVRHAWESFKQREKPKRTSVMEEIPRGLPALPQSNLMQKRAASVGFEWPGVDEVLAKVEEELAELRVELGATSKEKQREEFGDILFALVSVARHLRLDPEEALRLANRKFGRRFRHVETRVGMDGQALRDLSPEQLDEYWNEAKLAALEP